MLVLSRKKNETIVVDDTIRVTVVEIRGDKVRLGIDAPREISVHRQEVYDAIMAESRQAAGQPVGTPSGGRPSTAARPSTGVAID